MLLYIHLKTCFKANKTQKPMSEGEFWASVDSESIVKAIDKVFSPEYQKKKHETNRRETKRKRRQTKEKKIIKSPK